jgi:hypothetical protein
MKKWTDLFDQKNGKLYWKEARGRKAAGSEAGTNHGDGYKTVRIDGKAYYVHRVVMEITTGKKIRSGDVDHKDRDRSNNSPTNLRQVTRSENNKNRKSWAKVKAAAKVATKVKPKPKAKPKPKPKPNYKSKKK